ncbi:hypothetical protein OPT61_g9330 [Boeremia exigua]|uniref:Uncharacterized protein n=1 Tax=Boeremia exigua TaxID=749465 RepID=A0ACC2HW61_9PLEO|nr:hypothetical protein OPT61_g9330 [Boeremia exigua]
MTSNFGDLLSHRQRGPFARHNAHDVDTNPPADSPIARARNAPPVPLPAANRPLDTTKHCRHARARLLLDASAPPQKRRPPRRYTNANRRRREVRVRPARAQHSDEKANGAGHGGRHWVAAEHHHPRAPQQAAQPHQLGVLQLLLDRCEIALHGAVHAQPLQPLRAQEGHCIVSPRRLPQAEETEEHGQENVQPLLLRLCRRRHQNPAHPLPPPPRRHSTRPDQRPRPRQDGVAPAPRQIRPHHVAPLLAAGRRPPRYVVPPVRGAD